MQIQHYCVEAAFPDHGSSLPVPACCHLLQNIWQVPEHACLAEARHAGNKEDGGILRLCILSVSQPASVNLPGVACRQDHTEEQARSKKHPQIDNCGVAQTKNMGHASKGRRARFRKYRSVLPCKPLWIRQKYRPGHASHS